MAMPTLYTQAQNSAGERVRIAFALKGAAYGYVSVAAFGREAYRRLNPQGLMPALVVDGRVIAQSTAILEWLEESRPTPALLPADPLDRAEARAFAQLIASDMHPLNNNRVRRYLAETVGAGETAVRGWYDHWMMTGLAALEEMLARRPATPFCFGDRPGWADLHLVPQMRNARRFACDLSPYPRLRAIEAACLPLAAFASAAPDAQPDYWPGWPS
jgi:maleylacetoacetate isomerase